MRSACLVVELHLGLLPYGSNVVLDNIPESSSNGADALLVVVIDENRQTHAPVGEIEHRRHVPGIPT